MDIQRLRAETPGCAERIHLNNAGAALMPAPVVRALQDHVDLESRIGGYEAEELRAPAIAAAYRSVAQMLGTESRNIAFTENATVSNLQAISSIPFAAGDLILTGTPTGAGTHANPPVWLKPGDVLEIEVPEIGTLRNTVVDEA